MTNCIFNSTTNWLFLWIFLFADKVSPLSFIVKGNEYIVQAPSRHDFRWTNSENAVSFKQRFAEWRAQQYQLHWKSSYAVSPSQFRVCWNCRAFPISLNNIIANHVLTNAMRKPFSIRTNSLFQLVWFRVFYITLIVASNNQKYSQNNLPVSPCAKVRVTSIKPL